MARIWDKYVSDLDRQVYQASGFAGKRMGFGNRPAIVVIDVQYRTVGEDKPILESIKVWPTSCGDTAWKAVRNIKMLLDVARPKKIPVIYANVERASEFEVGRWKDKIPGMTDAIHRTQQKGVMNVEEVAPQPGDIMVSKRYASAFFGTPLMTFLNQLDVDTVVLTGCTTSGCVRATTIDAFSFAFKVAVPEDCVYDRGEVTHALNLFDINSKYADVIPAEEVKNYLLSLPERTTK